MPSYTHIQRAEPVLVAHWLLAYVEMILRDAARLRESLEPWMTAEYQWRPIAAGLEDAFISLMDTAKDNFS